MPKPPKKVGETDLNKAGLQDDHDPNDIGQRQNSNNDLPSASHEGREFQIPKKLASPYNRDDR